MFNTATKRIGWCLLVCIIIGGVWLFRNIVPPSLAAPHPTKPLLQIQTGRFGSPDIAISSDGNQLIYLNSPYKIGGNVIRRWDLSSGQQLPPLTSNENFIALSSTGRYYASQEKQAPHQLHFYQLDNQQLINTSALASAKEFTTSGNKYLPINNNFHESVDAATAELVRFVRHNRPLPLVGEAATGRHNNMPDHSVATSPDGSKVISMVTIPTEEEIRHYRLSVKSQPPQKIHVQLIDHLTGKTETLPSKIAFVNPYTSYRLAQISRDNNLYAAASTSTLGGSSNNGEDGSIWCYDLSRKSLRWKYFRNHYYPTILEFSPDGSMLAVGGHDNELRGTTGFLLVLDTQTGKLAHEFTEQTLRDQLVDHAQNIYFDLENGTLFRLNFYFRKLGINKIRSNNNYHNDLAPHDSGIPMGIAWSADNKMIAANYIHGDAKLWRVRDK